MTLTRLDGVAIGYDGRPLLRGISLTIRAGQTLAVVGPNGAGKSTLLLTMLGRLAPLEGKVERKAELRIGYVPQRGRHDPMFGLGVSEVVAMGGLGPGLRPASLERATAALDRMGIGALRDRRFRELSGGQQQRALIARALVREPQLLVLDEPSAGMDIPSEHDLLRLLKTLVHETEMAIVFVTHQLAFAAEYAETIALLNQEQGLFALDTAEALLTAPRLTQLYGRPMEVLEIAGQKVVRPS